MRASASSRPSGRGCSMSVTPASAQAARFASKLSGFQPSLASTISCDPRRGAAYRRDPRAVVVAAELHLEQGPPRGLLGRRRHRRRRAERDGIGGGQRPRCAQAGQFVDPPAGLLGVNVPVSTIECITGSTGGHGALQGAAVEAPPQHRAYGFDRCHNAVRSFAVAFVGDGLAAAAVGAIAQFGHHHDGFGLAAAADGENAGQRPPLDPDGEFHARSNMTGDISRAQGSQSASGPARSRKA